MDPSFHANNKLKACTGRNSLESNRINELYDDILIRIVSLLTMKEAAKTSVLSKRWKYVWAYFRNLNFDACSKSNRFNELPDNILIHIVSLLTLKEAGSTSVLSKRWKYVWAYSSSRPVYASNKIQLYSNTKSQYEEQESRYFRWVDQVVSSHKAPAIDEFRVKFELDKDRKDNIDNWVSFAIKKRVKRLELNLSPYNMNVKKLSYNFPSSSSCNSLTSLQLVCVNVTGEVLEKLLCDCRALESMSIEFSELLVKLKVAGSSLNLKSLRIKRCFNIKLLEISAPSLTYFNYSGPKLQCSPFKSIPKLSRLFIGSAYGTHLFSDLSSFISQIEELTLESAIFKLVRVARVFPVCRRLKTLCVHIRPRSDTELFDLRFLMKNCPLLHKFVLQLEMSSAIMVKTESTRNVPSCLFYHLKIVEVAGFVGLEVDTSFVMYLIENSVSLEYISIDSNIFDRNTFEKRRKRVLEKTNELRPNLNLRTKLRVNI